MSVLNKFFVFVGVFLVGMAAVFFGGGFSATVFVGEFDPGSGRTLAACLTHASRTDCMQLVVCG